MFASLVVVTLVGAARVERCADQTSCERCVTTRCHWFPASATCTASNASAACLVHDRRQTTSGCNLPPRGSRRRLDGEAIVDALDTQSNAL